MNEEKKSKIIKVLLIIMLNFNFFSIRELERLKGTHKQRLDLSTIENNLSREKVAGLEEELKQKNMQIHVRA
jgi:hypothetical protein